MSSESSTGGWREYGEPPVSRVLDAALEAFAEHGYHGTSIRDLAERAGLSVAGLYHHHRSKQEILVQLMMAIMDELQERNQQALSEAGPDPRDQFDILVESMLRFHMYRTAQAFISSSEIRSLEGENHELYVARRDAQQHIMDEIVAKGVETGAFTTPYPADASRAVASLCVGVAAWFRPDGELTVDDLVDRHLAIARGIVGAA